MAGRGRLAAWDHSTTMSLLSSDIHILEISDSLLVATVGTCQYQLQGVGWPRKMDCLFIWPQ